MSDPHTQKPRMELDDNQRRLMAQIIASDWKVNANVEGEAVCWFPKEMARGIRHLSVGLRQEGMISKSIDATNLSGSSRGRSAALARSATESGPLVQMFMRLTDLDVLKQTYPDCTLPRGVESAGQSAQFRGDNLRE